MAFCLSWFRFYLRNKWCEIHLLRRQKGTLPRLEKTSCFRWRLEDNSRYGNAMTFPVSTHRLAPAKGQLRLSKDSVWIRVLTGNAAPNGDGDPL